SEWDADGDGVPDSYFLVTNAGKLNEQLENAFTRITELVGASASSVAINSTVLRTNSRLYQATFNTTDWSGELRAFSLASDATVITPEVWSATSMIPAHGSRNIFTTVVKSGTDTPIAFNDSDADLIAAVGSAAIINYIRGDQSGEEQNGGFFRDRSVVLGDIVNASPISVADQNFGYDFLPDATEAGSYLSYVGSKTTLYTGANGERFSIIYAGANDGMLHAFIDSTDSVPSTAGQEIFAYVPSMLHGRLNELTNKNYSHKFFVDGTPHASDAFIGGGWITMLVATLGYGGQGIYALDISDPENFSTSDVMWEVDAADQPEMGFVLHQPVVAKLNNGDWGIIFGNGYNSTSQKAQLFILNASNGSLIKLLDTEVGSGASPNGLARPFLLDSNNDRIVDIIYAGDLQGNMWKFDVSNSNTNQWKVFFKQGNTLKPLYTAEDENGNPQAITTRPVVVNHPDGGYVVLFGTGKYIETGDNTIPATPQTQTFYGIRDDLTTNDAGSGRNNLVQQNILDEVDVLDDNGDVVNKARVVSDTTVNYSSKDGWYLDLISPINGAQAERVVANPLARFGRVIFTTFIPTGACEEGGEATIMELDAVSGARLENSVFDFNNDGVIDADDFVTYGGSQVPGSGIYIPATLASPAVITADDASQEAVLEVHEPATAKARPAELGRR
ncbi:MAG: PilC/PilY family type IV pilus protein, partial [Gammaproteobacteria bacterium]|nr:PilC/PilY family type IV pilus protein [Gammaproteobacteria bacterium]